MRSRVLALVVAAALGACGGDGPASTAPAPTCPSGQTLCNGQCAPGPCTVVVLANGIGGAAGVALSTDGGAETLYFTGYAAGTVGRLPLRADGTAGTVEILAQAQDGPSAILLAGGALYWTSESGGTVMMRPLTGCAAPCTPQPVATLLSGPWLLAANADSLAWGTHDGKVQRAALAGGPVQTLVSGVAGLSDIALDEANLYFTDFATGVVSLVPLPALPGTVDLAAVDLALPDGGSPPVAEVSPPVTLADQQAGPLSLAIDATSVYWTNLRDGSVMAAPIPALSVDAGAAATPAPRVLGAGFESPRALARDGSNLYFADYAADGGPLVVPAAGLAPGASPTVVAPRQPWVQWLAVGESSVYFTTFDGGALVKAPK